MEHIDLSGLWTCEIPSQSGPIRLPGTLDEGGFGHPDDPMTQWRLDDARAIGLWREGEPITTRLTRKHTYEGPAQFTRQLAWNVPAGKRVFLECERSRQLRLAVNGRKAPPCSPRFLSTPWVFEVTEAVTGRDTFVLTCDNSYPDWPRAAILRSSAATDESQTNWNGLLGYLRLRVEKRNFISQVRAYPHGDQLDVCLALDMAEAGELELTVAAPALAEDAVLSACLPVGRTELWARDLPLRPDVSWWDEGEGNLYPLTVSAPGLDSRTVRFGVRDFRAEGGFLTLNGRRFFLRGEANCAIFPETGYPPMDVERWREILLRYRAYGVNCMRFHSHCPPEAAFEAADGLGMLMQPELSHWDPADAFEAAESRDYYREELLGVLNMLANHPSFVMLTLGNELHPGEAGTAYAAALLKEARTLDPTRLYANGSNTHYGRRGCDPANDFHTSGSYRGRYLRAIYGGMKGWLNEQYPDFRVDYIPALAALRQESEQPVFSFEVGQYEVLPDFRELDAFRGVTDPANYRAVRDRAAARGMLADWENRVEATGELALLCYRAEVEAALRTGGMSGISLLGLQDFHGQGTALIGMMNAHLEPKPYGFAQPEKFRAFFRDVLPLALLPRFTYTSGESFTARVRLANYGKQDLTGVPAWSLAGEGVAESDTFSEVTAPAGGLTDLGTISVGLDAPKAARLTLTVSFCGAENTYPIWVYPDETPVCPENVHECRSLDKAALAVLRDGGRVYLSPPATAEAMPGSVQCHFSPDFWSVGSFSHQEGTMGQLIDAAHPIFRDFPTDFHTDWQWWPMANQRAVLLPEGCKPIIAELDSYAYLRPLAQLAEFRCGGGRLLLSSLGLQDLQQYPEARALQRSIYRYLASDGFDPDQEISPEALWRRCENSF